MPADSATQGLGVVALEAMLKTNHFIGSSNYEFGARARDYGYHPKTGQEWRDWYAAVLRFAEPLAVSDGVLAERVRNAIGQELRGLWTNSGQVDEIERLAQAIAAKRFWREGWISVRQTRIYDGGGLPPDNLRRLTALEELLRPKELVNKVRGIVINANSGSLDFDDLDDVQDYLTENGVMDPKLLYESPFTDMSSRGPEGVFSPVQVDQLVAVLTEIRERAAA